MAHLPKIKRKIFWEGHSTLPDHRGHSHGASASNLVPSALAPLHIILNTPLGLLGAWFLLIAFHVSIMASNRWGMSVGL